MNQFDTLYFQKYLTEDDELLFVCHRHPILVVDNILLWCFFGGVLPIFFYLQNTFGLATIIEPAWFELFLLAIYFSIIYQVFDWYNDAWVITNRGIIDVTWNVFSGSTNYLSYDAVHGIEVRSKSFLDPMLNKGDIWIHLENETQQFYLPDAANPQAIVEYVHAVIDEMKHDHDHDHHEEDDRKPFELLLDTLTEMVKEHLEKKGNGPEPTMAEKADIDRALRYASTVDLRDTDSR